VAVRILADDIRPIHRGLEPVTGFRPGLVAALASLLSPAVAFLGLLVIQRRNRDRSENRDLYRRRGALRAALRRLDAKRDSTDSVDGASVSTILRSYVGDRLGDSGGSRTTEECVSGLLAAGLPRPLAARLEALLVELDAAQYGAAGSDHPCFARAELGSLLSEIDEALERC